MLMARMLRYKVPVAEGTFKSCFILLVSVSWAVVDVLIICLAAVEGPSARTAVSHLGSDDSNSLYRQKDLGVCLSPEFESVFLEGPSLMLREEQDRCRI